MPRASAWGRAVSTLSEATAPRSRAPTSRTSLPASTWARKSRSPTRWRSRCEFRSTTPRNSRCSSVRSPASPSSSSSVYPRIEVSGVRSSWDERDELVLEPVELAQALVLGEQVALGGLCERPGLLLRGEQALAIGLGPLALGDVLPDRRDADDFPRRVADGRVGERHVDEAVVLAPADRLELADPILRDDLPQDVEGLGTALLGHERRERLTEHLLGGVAEHPLRARVPARVAEIQRGARDRVARGLDDSGQPRSGLLRQLALGDVDEEALHPEGCAPLVSHEDRLVEDPDDSPVRRDVAVLGAEGLARPAQAIGVGEDAFDVVVMDGVVHEARVLDPLRGRVAEKRLDLRAHVDVPHRCVRGADVGHERQVLDERAIAKLRLAKRRLGPPALLPSCAAVQAGARARGWRGGRSARAGRSPPRRTSCPGGHRRARARRRPLSATGAALRRPRAAPRSRSAQAVRPSRCSRPP